MAKSHKLKDDNYWDSSSITHNQESISNFIIGKEVKFTKSIRVTTANTWYDTGISGQDLESGTHIMQVYTGDYNNNEQFAERLSGILAWYSSDTNSSNVDEIPLSKAGHARNNHNIKLRFTRQTGNLSGKLQITDSTAWSGNATVSFTFRRLI